MKKFMMFFAGVCLLVMSAVSFTSCGSDDDKKSGTVLTGTTWEGSLVIKDGGNTLTTSMQISFAETTYSGYLTGGIPVTTTTLGGSYTMSSDNKTVYLEAAKGQTVGKISNDGKTMTISSTENNTTGELTKK